MGLLERSAWTWMATMEAEDEGGILLHVVQGVKLKKTLGGKEQAILAMAMAQS